MPTSNALGRMRKERPGDSVRAVRPILVPRILKIRGAVEKIQVGDNHYDYLAIPAPGATGPTTLLHPSC